MKKVQFVFLTIIILIFCFGCEKDSEAPSPSIADDAVGVYSGSWTINSMNAASTCEVVKVSGTSVDLKMTVVGQSIPTLPNVTLTDGGNGKIKLSYSDSGGSLNGTIQNNSISFTLVAGTISGTYTGYK